MSDKLEKLREAAQVKQAQKDKDLAEKRARYIEEQNARKTALVKAATEALQERFFPAETVLQSNPMFGDTRRDGENTLLTAIVDVAGVAVATTYSTVEGLFTEASNGKYRVKVLDAAELLEAAEAAEAAGPADLEELVQDIERALKHRNRDAADRLALKVRQFRRRIDPDSKTVKVLLPDEWADAQRYETTPFIYRAFHALDTRR